MCALHSRGWQGCCRRTTDVAWEREMGQGTGLIGGEADSPMGMGHRPMVRGGWPRVPQCPEGHGPARGLQLAAVMPGLSRWPASGGGRAGGLRHDGPLVGLPAKCGSTVNRLRGGRRGRQPSPQAPYPGQGIGFVPCSRLEPLWSYLSSRSQWAVSCKHCVPLPRSHANACRAWQSAVWPGCL